MERFLGKVILLLVCFITVCFSVAAQQVPSLGTAFGYNALADKNISSTGRTVINANVGVANGTITGFPPGIAVRGTQVNTPAARTALQDAATAFNQALALTPTEVVLSNGNLANRTYTPGVYKFEGDAVFAGNMILDDNGQQNPVFIFQVENDLKVNRSAEIDATNKATTSNILWVVKGNIDISSNAILDGSFIAQGSINLATGVNLQGRLISLLNDIYLNQALINTPSDLSVSIAMSPSTSGTTSYQLGEEVTITITAKNLGPSDESIANGTISLIGDILSYTSVKPGSSFNITTKEWNIGSLAFNQSAVLVIKAKLTQSGFGTVQARVEGRSGNVDEDLNNNTAAPYNYCVLLSASGPIAGETQVCIGSTFTYSIAPVVGAARYNWAVPDGWTYERLGPTSILVTPGSTSGLITVRASSICGEGPPQSLQVTSQADTPLKPGPITGPFVVCANTNGWEYSISAVANAASYNWVVPNGWSISGGQGTAKITVNAGSTQGVITVEAVNACGTSEKQSLTVSAVTDLPLAPVFTQSTAQGCVGSTVVYQVEAVAGVTGYNWTVPATWEIISGQNTARLTVKVGSDPGELSVKATNVCGTGPATILTVKPAQDPPVQPGPITGVIGACATEKGLVYTIQAVPDAKSYTWTVPAGWVITAGQGSLSITVNAGSNSGAITVKAVNDCGVGSASSLQVQPIPGAPAKPGSITGEQAPCINSTATYEIPVVAGASGYTWAVPAGWEIISGQGTTQIVARSGNAGGIVTVESFNACGISQKLQLPVAVTANVPTTPSPIQGTSQGCVGSTISYQVAAVTGATGYTWAVPAGWEIISGQNSTKLTVKVGSTAGNITVRASNACGTGILNSLAVKPVTTPPAIPGPITEVLTVCASKEVTYSIAAVQNATGYTWSVPTGWAITAGQGTLKITVTAGSTSGTITVKALNDCGPGGASSLQVQPVLGPPKMPASIIGSEFTCANTTATYQIPNITGATGYNWTIPTGWTLVSGQNTTTITVTANATAGKVTVTASNACGSSAPLELLVTPLVTPPATPVISGPAEVCEGVAGFVYEVATVPGVSSYTWEAPADWTITGQGTNKISVKAGKTQGKVSVKLTNECGLSSTGSISVKVIPSPPDKPVAILGLGIVCVDQKTIRYRVEPVANATSYRWAVSDGWEIVSGQGTTDVVVNASSRGTKITVQAVNACGVTSLTQLTAIVTNAAPAKPVITGNTFPCTGAEYTYSIAPLANADSYTWDIPEGWEKLADNGTSVTVRSGGKAGTIAVRATNGCGIGETATLAVKAVVSGPENLVSIIGNSLACVGATTTFKVEGVQNVNNYTWKVPAGWSIVSGQGTAAVQVKVGTKEGEVGVTAKNGCGETYLGKTIKVSDLSLITLGKITGAIAMCEGATQTYSINAVGTAASYAWSVPAGWTIVSGQGTVSLTVRAGKNSGNIGVAAVNSCGSPGPETKLAVAPSAIQLIPPVITKPASPFCQGAASLTYSIPAVNGATSYQWEVPQGWQLTEGQGTTVIKVTAGTEAGLIKVKIGNGCGQPVEASINAVTQTLPAAPKLTSGAPDPCTGADTQYTVQADANVVSYDWILPQGWTILQGHGTNKITVKATATSGLVKVKAINACGASEETVLPVNPVGSPPAAIGAISGEQVVCENETVVYAVAKVELASGYSWTIPQGWTIVNGQGTNTLTVKAGNKAGTVKVAATNGCGATADAAVKVQLRNLNRVGVITDLSSACDGLVYEMTPLEGAQSYKWTVPEGWTIATGQGTNRITVNAGKATGKITVVASNGQCLSEQAELVPNTSFLEAEVIVPNVFTPNGDGNNDTWIIENLANFPEKELTILNRWGNEVYRSPYYENNWDGSGLHEGTYFYVLKVKLCSGDEKVYKGYVMIVR
ncbi:ice-binding family protein [Pontibacter arcticus]|uniref:Uncharacterized protein n=1 Tax=Pontibacter arcticus TaxID=2080288 RepID=A0A364RJ95_9BACT|nr:ice-binding family protein [Pontibacter arcticus]RAU84345.1 hypothetical protein DP923_04720 [Pontibacter arcticus]